MSLGVAIIVVGGAVLVPTLLEVPAGAVDPATGLADNSTQTILPGHRAAATQFRTRAILGVVDKQDPNKGLFIGNRLREIFASLRAQQGSVSSSSPNFPKLTPQQMHEVLTQLLDAVRVGITVDSPRDGYVLSKELKIFPRPEFVDQGEALDTLMGAVAGGVPSDFEEPSELAKAVGEATARMFQTLTVGFPNPDRFDATAGCRAASALANTMDQQGINFDITDLGDLADSIKDSASALPGRIGSLLGGTLGDVIGNIFLSVPVLLGIAGYIVYRSVKS